MKTINIPNVQEIGLWDNGSKNGVNMMNHERYLVIILNMIFLLEKKIIKVADKAPYLQ